VIRLYAAADLTEAHLIVGMLGTAGIEARIFNQHARGALGELPLADTYPVIWLEQEADAARARDIIARYERPGSTPPDAQCPTCGEANPGDFDICWHCGGVLSS
jgi:hypothetical protein